MEKFSTHFGSMVENSTVRFADSTVRSKQFVFVILPEHDLA
jgi:hypothetical protein